MRQVLPYITAQVVGAIAGVAVANAMFGEPVFAWSQRARHGGPQLLGEAIATFGLLMVIIGCGRHRPEAVAGAVASYITAAYWFTASTSFANPAVTVARSLTNTFAGILPGDVPGFVAAQLAGGGAAVVLMRWLMSALPAPQTRAGRQGDVGACNDWSEVVSAWVGELGVCSSTGPAHFPCRP